MAISLKNKIKIALRITHNYLDGDIDDTILTAKRDMVRAGIKDEMVESADELIESMIKTYCLYVYAPDDKMAEGYFKSYQYQLDNARKSSGYSREA